jgi:PAS domain-containing protein
VSAERHPVEIIMARGFMSNLTTAAFLVDREGALVFFNDAAGELLGLRFEDAGPMPAEEWGARFEPTDPGGGPLPLEELPLAIALMKSRPAHRRMVISPAEGERRCIEVSAFPVVGRGGQSGAMAIFWDDSG